MTIKEFKVQYVLGMISLDDKINIARTTTSKRILAILSRDENNYVRRNVAGNKNTSTEVLVALSKDGNYDIRYYVAYNKNNLL